MSFIGIALMVFIISMTGSLHCAAMCGPLTLAVVKNQTQNILYQFGRLWSYLSLGVFAGWVGYQSFNLSFMSSLGWIVTIATSTYFILSGIFLWMNLTIKSVFWHQFINKITFQILKISSQNQKALLLGLITAFLPCGWLYLFVGAAVLIADPIQSPLLLFIFWLGNMPIFYFLNRIKSWLQNEISFFSKITASALLILLGLFIPLAKLSNHSSLLLQTTHQLLILPQELFSAMNSSLDPKYQIPKAQQNQLCGSYSSSE